MNWEVRTYQQEAVAACLAEFVERRQSSVMLESPVGSGKTYMALETIHALQQILGRTLRVNWVAPRRHLLQQVMEANRDLHQDMIRPVSLFEKTPPEADLAVLDEAHHEATQSCVMLYEKMKCPLVLGLSATPLRTDRMKLSFQSTVTTCAIDRLIREGYLSPFHSYLLPNYGPQIVGECYLNDPAKWGKALAFFPTVPACVEFQRFLVDHGVKCEVVTAESDKDRQLEDFMGGRVRVIANVAMLTEGFDQPDVQTVFARDASRLPTIQMCGRGLRRADGKTHCNIVQSAKTAYLFERVSPAQRRFRLMNGQWTALQDGTEMIESTLKVSLSLLEQREKRRQERQSERVSRVAPKTSSMHIADMRSIPTSPYYQCYKPVYECLYRYYDLCNEIAWQGTLPPAALLLNRQRRSTRISGYALANATRVNGRLYPALSLTLAICARGNTASLMTLLLHEMTHIWQFAQGKRGGHGRDFREKLLDLGLDEAGQRVRTGSAADRIGHLAEARWPNLTARLRACCEDQLPSSQDEDFAFFRLMLESGGKW